MATWTGSPITVEEAFNQVWKSTVEIQPSFYFPLTTSCSSSNSSANISIPSSTLASPPIGGGQAESVTSSTSNSTEDDLATAEILARIKFGTSSPTESHSTESRKRSLTSSLDGEDQDSYNEPVKQSKRKKESSIESTTSGITNTISTRDGSGGGGGGGGGSAERWPPRKEFVYLTCVVAIPPVGRQKLPLFGKPCGRNEIIAKVVTMATGEGCSRKLISSHAQVLKGRKELSKQLRDLLTTEEGKNNDDEAAPTVYTLGPDWNFPKCLNRLIGLPEILDLRTASPPSLITQHFSDISKPIKSLSTKKERSSSSNKNKLTIKTRPSKSLSPSVFSTTTTASSSIGNSHNYKPDDRDRDHHVHLPTPNSAYLPSSYMLPGTPSPAHHHHHHIHHSHHHHQAPYTDGHAYVDDYDYGYDYGHPQPQGYDRNRDRSIDRNIDRIGRPLLPSPSTLFSPSYGLSTPRRASEYGNSPITVPRRPATANSMSASTSSSMNRHLPPPESPISITSIIDSPMNKDYSRRTSESQVNSSNLSLGKSFSTFERDCLKSPSNNNNTQRISGVSIEDMKRKERNQQLFLQ
ncbi:uncharacterized protein L201_004391 [Kwoniella dendrophila CBS 6074]|uniref:TEA domain-containing protein n=1 Tax=Kwoniella dendrophila CBS 6074 TaxID=1295534 RepID=A0AAX4JVR5_9TREE